MSNAARQSTLRRKTHAQNQGDIGADLFKRLKLKLQSQAVEAKVTACPVPKAVEKVPAEKERFIEIEVEVPVERIVEKVVEVERVVYVARQGKAEHVDLVELFSALIASKL